MIEVHCDNISLRGCSLAVKPFWLSGRKLVHLLNILKRQSTYNSLSSIPDSLMAESIKGSLPLEDMVDPKLISDP